MLKPNSIIQADVIDGLRSLPDGTFQLIIADPPYGNVLVDHAWDTDLDADSYLAWTAAWFRAALVKLRPNGLIYVFGQLGQREHRWIEVTALLCRSGAFHDQLIWDRVVGYNDRRDSYTPAYEICLVLKKSADAQPYFNKDAVRIPYDKCTIDRYLKDKRYKDMDARRAHLETGKFATNLLRVPSLKGSSREKVGHPSQKPERLIEMLISSSSKKDDWVLDPFFGSGTTGVVGQRLGRKWVGIERDSDYCEMARARLRRLNSEY
ncbi:DNA-methyltransferase [Synoicihabitans lomoniglobus]|uniref:Methyltransferase n=1 Tax=Synoicihabitans lomoniglobus TaxID=2909285 RepID=A0AAF0CQQ9_9BACT|nr:site-specific DNA-methyltransferase [Opitutaceae bacterium LMO-M01]WED66339.1 site-specific DNA-methyltransferase [Opitutaceae bacterium LMO-M01]